MKKVFLYLFMLAVTTRLSAQAPVITSNTGIPVGNASVTGIAYGNGVYVTVLREGKIYTSADGEKWTKVTDASVPAGSFNNISFGAGLFVIAGSNGLIASSANGVNWTVRTSNTTNALNDVQFIQGKFYTAGMNTTLRSSADGITWATITMGSGTSTDMLMSITYGNGVFVIGGRNTGGSYIYVYYSATAASGSWTWKNVDPSTGSALNKVQYLKDKFYAFTSGTGVYTSTNGSTWTNSTASLVVTLPNSTTQNIGTPNQCFHGIYDGTKVYFFGYSGYYQSYGAIFSSANGTSFTLQPKTAYMVCQGAAFVNGKYFEYGNEGVSSSTDGINYKYPGGSYYGMASNGSNYVGVGVIGESGVVFSSADFSDFSEKTLLNQPPVSAIVYTGTKYVAAGAKTVIESADGNSWTQIATPTTIFTALAYNSTRFVGGTADPSTYAGGIAYSADGISWTTASTADNYYFRMKYVNGNFFALGYSNSTYQGVIMQSANGITWNNITPTTSYATVYFNDVLYDGSKYHFMGMDYTDLASYTYGNFFSLSTSTFTNPNSFTKAVITNRPGVNLGGTYGDGAFAFSNGHYVGAVVDVTTQQTNIIYSTDGTSWTAIPVDEISSVTGIVAEGDEFKMMGTADGKFTVFFTVPLATNLLTFTAMPVGDKAVLKWKAANASSTAGYLVQRSTDEVNWTDLKLVAAATDNAQHTYDYIDATPAAGVNYYRLQQDDAVGSVQHSKVVKVNFDKKELLVYPNPSAGGTINVTLPGAGNLSMFNSAGLLVLSKTLTAGNHQLNVSRLARGVYTIKTTGAVSKVILQ